MRVVFVGHSAGLLGAERSMFDILSGAVGDGHEVAVVLPTIGPLAAALRGVGATVLIHPMRAWMGAQHWIPAGWSGPPYWQAARTAEGLVTIVRRLQPDVVVTNTSVIPAGAIAARRLAIPHVWIVRESLRDNPQLRSFLPKRWIAREIIRRSAALCTISPYVEEQIDELAATRHPRSFTLSPNPERAVHRAQLRSHLRARQNFAVTRLLFEGEGAASCGAGCLLGSTQGRACEGPNRRTRTRPFHPPAESYDPPARAAI